MENLDVVVIAQFSGDGKNSNNRFREVCSDLSETGANVELVTSTFLHAKKKHSDLSLDDEVPFKVTQIDEPGYEKNVSIRRIMSHRKLASNLEKYLTSRQVPDVIYCAVPSLEIAATSLKFARREKVRIIFDIQDLWPEAFEMVIKPRFLAKLGLWPLKKKADALYRGADEIVTVSETYSRRVMNSRQGRSSARTVYLGTRLEKFDQYPALPWESEEHTLHLVYIGTLGHSYDLPLVFDSLRELKRKNIVFTFHIMGSGPMENQWKIAAEDLSDSVQFHGRLPYGEMVSRLKSCDIAINPIVAGSAGSIINKVCDYAAASLPVVNTQDNVEYRELLADFGGGINCEATVDSMSQAIIDLYHDESRRRLMAAASRSMAVELFDRTVSYRSIRDLILE